MLFTPALVELIRSGDKTQTRRPLRGFRCPVILGEDYAVQPGRGRRAQFRIRVIGLRQEKLGDVTRKDAYREGFTNIGQLIEMWSRLYGHFDADEVVWVIDFEAIDPPEQETLI